MLFIAPIFANSIYITNENGTEIANILIKRIVEVDSNSNNRILQVWTTANELNVKVQVSDKKKQINITVYNMLGKEVIKVYEGYHYRDEDAYTSNINLPNGIYICVLRGNGFKNAEKFIVSK